MGPGVAPSARRQARPGHFIMRSKFLLFLVLWAGELTLSIVRADSLPWQIQDSIVLPLGGRGGGHAEFPVDFVAAQMADGSWKTPHDGDELTMPGGSTRKWQKASAGTNGWFTGRGLGGGYLFYSFHTETDQGALLEAAGHEMVYVNGAPRVGDIYANETALIPVHLHSGENEFAFSRPGAGG